MNDPLQDLINALKPSTFPPNSRYANIQTASLETPDGRVTVYLRRRFVLPANRFAEIQQYTTSQGERVDQLAARLVGDPERFWQLCDANNAMQPEELTETPGRNLRVTLPEGIPGSGL
jgi:hypothetical protein